MDSTPLFSSGSYLGSVDARARSIAFLLHPNPSHTTKQVGTAIFRRIFTGVFQGEFFLIPLLWSLATLSSGAGLFEKTPGEQFRAAMESLEKNCATRKHVEPGDVSCEILNLKPFDPLATEEGRFAHAIRLPPPHDKPKIVYRKGMKPEEYFKALCDAEAGEFIFRTVDNVDGILQMRRREQATDNMLMHLYALEDPYGYRHWETQASQYIFLHPSKYRFFEQATSHRIESEGVIVKFRRFQGYDGKRRDTVHFQNVPMAKSQYGYIWRGIQRPYDRVLGIAGGELIVLYIPRNEVLAFKRGFIRSARVPNNLTGIWWLTGRYCRGDSTRLFSAADFIEAVLRPVH
jgi:hypothetical protein